MSLSAEGPESTRLSESMATLWVTEDGCTQMEYVQK